MEAQSDPCVHATSCRLPLTIQHICARHELTFGQTINLVASENILSPYVRRLLASDFAHRYLIPPASMRPRDIWDYPNQKYTRRLERHASRLACRIYHAGYADLRPLSGNQIIFILLSALLSPGKRLYSVPADCGGHFTTRHVCRALGIEHCFIPYDKIRARVDLDTFADRCKTAPPDLVFLDASMILFPYPLKDIRSILPQSTIISYDASHTFGLIGGGAFQAPLKEGADVLHGSTHKSLFGPQKGMILTSNVVHSEPAKSIFDIVTPLFVSNAHVHHIAALGGALEELMEYGAQYARAVIANAQLLGHSIYNSGVDVFHINGVFTNSHQIFICIGDKTEAFMTMQALEAVGIHVNATRVPFTDRFGMRLGLSEATRRGCGETEMRILGELITDVILKRKPIDHIKNQVKSLSRALNLVRYGFD